MSEGPWPAIRLISTTTGYQVALWTWTWKGSAQQLRQPVPAPPRPNPPVIIGFATIWLCPSYGAGVLAGTTLRPIVLLYTTAAQGPDSDQLWNVTAMPEGVTSLANPFVGADTQKTLCLNIAGGVTRPGEQYYWQRLAVVHIEGWADQFETRV